MVSIPSWTLPSKLHTPTWEGSQKLPWVRLELFPFLPDDTREQNYKEGTAL